MTNSKQPLGEPVVVSSDIGYQLYSRTYNQQRRFSARVGKVWINPEKQAVIIPEFDLYSADHFRKAMNAAKKHLAQVKAEVFEAEVNSARHRDATAPRTEPSAGKAPGTVAPVWSK